MFQLILLQLITFNFLISSIKMIFQLFWLKLITNHLSPLSDVGTCLMSYTLNFRSILRVVSYTRSVTFPQNWRGCLASLHLYQALTMTTGTLLYYVIFGIITLTMHAGTLSYAIIYGIIIPNPPWQRTLFTYFVKLIMQI